MGSLEGKVLAIDKNMLNFKKIDSKALEVTPKRLGNPSDNVLGLS